MQQAKNQVDDVSSKVEETTDSNSAMKFIKDCIGTISEQNLSGYAQMVAYNLLFATAPVLMVTVAGAAAITRAVNSDLENPATPLLRWMQDNLPADAAQFLNEPIQRAVQADSGWIFSIGGLLALWGARGAVAAVIKGLDMAYGTGKDERNFIVQNGIAIGITLLLVALLGVGGVVFALGSDLGETVVGAIGLGGAWNTFSQIVRYPLILAIAIFAVMVLHRFGPTKRLPFKAYLPGAAFTVIAMVVATFALSFWLANSGGFSATYGIFGSVMAFILWLFVMGFVILIGGVINANLQKDTQAPPVSSIREA